MKITQLEYFCATCRHHSITQAARELYVTQPAISSAIRELEKEFSINLFVRSKNHVTLTKEGELFYLNKAGLEEKRISPISPSNYSSITAALASNILTIDEVHRNKIIVVTEGKTDKKLLEMQQVKELLTYKIDTYSFF